MSGVYISRMEMPTSCSECKLMTERGCFWIGSVGPALSEGRKAEDCPLVSADVVERASFENLMKSKDNQKIEDRLVGRWVLVADRKTGRWVLQDGYRCSVCYYKLQTTGLPTYCPNCGASMQSNTSNALDALDKEADTT